MGLATNMKQRPADESILVAVVGGIWGFGDKTDGTVIDCIQFVECWRLFCKRHRRSQGSVSEGMFGSVSEEGFVAK